MKYKKIMIMAILTVFLVSIAGACASDVNDVENSPDSTAIGLSQNDEINSTDESQVVGQSNAQETIISAAPGTFADLEDEILNGYNSVITLDRNYEYEGSGYSDGIQIDKPITIDGKGHVIDAKGQTRIFLIEGNNVTIKNLILINGFISGAKEGGAIRWNGANGNVSSCYFLNNTVDQGGAISWHGDNGVVCDSFFMNNRAKYVRFCYGGAIIWYGHNGNIFNSDFVNNTVDNGGGAICWISGSGDDKGAISGCNFVNNTAINQDGGAIYVVGSEVSILDCVFEGNHALDDTTYGGIVSLWASVPVVSGCYFVGNTARNGMVNIRNCNNVSVNNNIFLSNNGEAFGGSLLLEDVYVDYNWFGQDTSNYDTKPSVGSGVKLNNWLFLNATANPETITLTGTSDVTFKLYAYDMEKVSEYDNSLLNGVNLTISAINGKVSTKEARLGQTVQFSGDSVGKGIVTAELEFAIESISLTVVKGNTFRDLNKEINGNENDVIVLDRNYAYDPTTDEDFKDGIVINRPVKIVGNYYTIDAAEQARIFNIQSDNVTIQNTLFRNARTTGNGGTILWNGANGNLAQSIFVNSHADGDGGAVYWNGANGNVHDCDFEDISADTGGALYWKAANGNVYDCNFENTHADNGGAVYWNGENGNLYDCNFENSIADAGGAVYWNGAEGNVYGCDFVNNSARDGSGGAVYWNGAEGNVYGCDFVNNYVNSSSGYGGAIRWVAGDGVVSDCVFVNNSAYARSGGALYWSGANGAVYNSDFVNNSAKYRGGAIMWITSNGGVVSGCDFVNNFAVDSGGALMWYASQDGTVSECNFVNNYVEGSGGALMWYASPNGAVSGCDFVNNSADINGGAIWWSSSADGAVLDSAFENNRADLYGGAVMWDGSARGVVSGCDFVNNSAEEDGGAIDWTADDGNVLSCVFADNSANYGGAINWNGAKGNVSGSVFVNNSADNGIIYFFNSRYANLAVNDNIFLNNDGISIAFYKKDSTSNADYNWFGGNATNYSVEPSLSNVIIDNWLFLNATANPEALSIFESSDIIFKLYSYNSTETSDYDNSRVYSINLIITATNGDVEDSAILGESITYTATGFGSGSVTADFENAEYTIEILNKTNPNLSFQPQEVTYSNNTAISLDYDSAATGKVNISLKGKKSDYEFVGMDLNETVSLGDIDADEYDVIVSYSGDGRFVNASAKGTLTVNKADSTLTLNDIEFDYGTVGSGEISFTGASGVDVEVINHSEAVVNVEGNTITVSNLDAGNYTLAVTTIPDANHNALNVNVTITVRKVNSTIDTDDFILYYGESVNVSVTTEGAEAFTAEIDGESVEIHENIITIPGDLESGNHTLTITTVTDKNHNEATKTVLIVDCRANGNVTVVINGKEYSAKIVDGKVIIDTGIVKKNTTIGLNVSSVEDYVTFTVNVNPDATGIVRFEVSGAEDYTVYADVINGIAEMDDVLSVGDYEVVATYLGDDRFNSNITSESFTVKGHVKKDTPISADADVNGNKVTITVNVDENATGFVALKQSESVIYIAVEDGVATCANTFAAGSYNVEVIYAGDYNFNENNTRLLFAVVEAAKENTTISLDIETFENNATFTVNINPNATGIVRFEFADYEEYLVYKDVEDGKAVLTGLMDAGNYTLTVTYMGDDRFNTNATSESFTVKGHVKKDTPISADALVNGNRVTFTVNVDENATGFVNIKFDEAVFNIELDHGTGSFAINLPADSYNVDVIYLGDYNFNENSTRLSFTVTNPVKENTPISLDVTSFENNVTYTVNVDENATGIVRFEVLGAEVYVVYADIINGVVVLDDVLTEGDYTVIAIYLGSDRFNTNTTSESFTIKGHVKKDTPISADAVVNGNKVTVTVNVDENATGFVALKQSGSVIYIAVEDGVATYSSTFAAGSYNVEVTYLGDEDYNENSTRVLFTVVEIVKENTPISLDVSSVENNVTFTVNVNSYASGIVKFEVSGAEEYVVYADVINGVAVVDDVLLAGDYTVVATYMGDNRFNTNTTSESFTVKGHVKKDTPITANADVNGNKVTVTVNVDENATGFVNMKFDEAVFNIELDDGTGSFTINLPADSYNVDVIYLGDYNFNENSTRLSFTVTNPVKDNTPISLDVTNFENNVTYTVNVNPDATGIVRFEVLGAEVYVVYADVINGVVIVDDVLKEGDYTVIATYLGSDRFNTNVTSESFTIKGHVKKDTPISADAVVNGNKVTVTVNVDENATGFVALKQSGSVIYVALEDGVATYSSNFAVGSYNVEVTYLGDDDFNENSTRVLFTVVEAVKENTPISLDVTSFENNVTFTVSLNPDATGIVKFEVSGAEEYVVYADVINGIAVVEDVLTEGDYTVVATYLGDNRFNTNATSESFTIKGHVKKDTPISADADVNGNKVTITVNVDENATGFVNMKFDEAVFNIELDDGTGSFTINLPADSYNIDVIYLGDYNFNENSTRLSFTVTNPVKENTPISLDVTSFENNVTYTVNVDENATGIVRFEVLGAEVYSVYADVINGVVVLDDVLKEGDYTVIAIYLGSDRFNTNTTSESFTIKGHVKKDTPISADAFVNGNKVTITVNVDENATGFVALKQSGSVIYIAVEDGIATYANNFAAGSYNVEVIYLGDEDFNENSTRVLFTVVEAVKENTPITLDVTSFENNVTFTVSLNPDATGIVRFEVSGAEEYVVYADVVNGIAVLDDVLKEGDYTVVATYLGDDRFNTNSTMESFTVSGHVKLNVTLNCDVDVNGYEVAVTVNVNESSVTGFIELNIAGKKYYAPVESGKAVFVSDFLAGTYMGNVQYLGDEKFNPATTLVFFSVTEQNITLKNTTIDVIVSSFENDVSIVAIVNSSATGLIEFIIDDTVVYMPINNGESDYELVLPAGEYNVTVTYLGDAKFNPNSTTESFVVYDHIKGNTTITADVTVNGNEVTMTVNVDSSATGFVEIDIADKKYYAPVESGKAVLTSYLTAGNYTASIIYGGDENYNPANTTALISIPEIEPEDANFTVSAVNNTITVKVNENATGYVLVDVDGTGYYASIENGQATVNVIGLDEGEYEAAVTYSGDAVFASANATVNVTVPSSGKNDTPVDPKADINISADGVEVILPEDATGYVLIDVDGTGYYTSLKDGKATFDLPELAPGNHTVSVTYTGDKKYASANATGTVTVDEPIESIISSDLTKVEKAPDRFEAVFTDAEGNLLVNSEVTFEINGNVYTRTTDAEGKAGMNINLEPGNYTITISNPVTGEVKNNTIIVKSRFEDAHDLVKYFRNESQYRIKVLGDDGKIAPKGSVVTFNINGVFYNRTVDENGYVKLNINLNPGTYIITGEYKGCRVSNTITVLPVLTAEDLTKKYSEADPFEAKLLDGQGKPYADQKLEFNINGVFYYRTTNSNGIAKLNINLMPNEYIITTKYGDAAISNTVTVTN